MPQHKATLYSLQAGRVITRTKQVEIPSSPLPTKEDILGTIREVRAPLLLMSDYTQLPDAPLSSVEKEKWGTYRQALRDITKGITDKTILDSVTWPTPPSTLTTQTAQD